MQRRLPKDDALFKQANQLSDLLAPLGREADVIAWPRGGLTKKFNKLALHLAQEFNLYSLRSFGTDKFVQATQNLTGEARKAADFVLQDIDFFQSRGHRPLVRLISGEIGFPPPDLDDAGFTSPYRLHVDEGCDKILCFYSGEQSTLFARHQDIDYTKSNPATNKWILKANAPLYQFQPGDIWAQASDIHENPFVHKGPAPTKGALPRLALDVLLK